MLFNSAAVAAAAVLLLPQAIAMPSPHQARGLTCSLGICTGPVKRAVCNADNALRDLRNPTDSSSASVFCSSYIRSTVTVSDNIIITTTQATVTPAPTTVEFNTTVYTTGQPLKRRTDTGLPSFVATLPPSRISSACSCFINATGLAVATTTLFSTSAVTATNTTTLPVTTTVVATPTLVPDCHAIGCSDGTGLISSTDDNISTTVELCLAKCSATKGCVSIEFGTNGPPETTRVCNLFSVPIDQTYDPSTSTDPYCEQFSFYAPVGCPAVTN